MKIQIREKDGVHFTLLFPTAVIAGLLGSRMTAKLIAKALQTKIPAGGQGAQMTDAVMQVQSALQPQTIHRIQKELKDCIRRNRRLTLVEVESADGDYVKIVL